VVDEVEEQPVADLLSRNDLKESAYLIDREVLDLAMWLSEWLRRAGRFLLPHGRSDLHAFLHFRQVRDFSYFAPLAAHRKDAGLTCEVRR
jgi:hypothetical protein